MDPIVEVLKHGMAGSGKEGSDRTELTLLTNKAIGAFLMLEQAKLKPCHPACRFARQTDCPSRP